MQLLSRLKSVWTLIRTKARHLVRARTRIRLIVIDTDEAKRLDEIRRDWVNQARQTQADFLRTSLLIVGGSMIALMSLLGVVLQARIPVDLKAIYRPLGWFSGSMLFLLVSVTIQAAAVGAVAVFALDADSTLARRAKWHGNVYWIAWMGWFCSVLLVLVGAFEAVDEMPELFDALQAGVNAAKPTP